MSYNEQVVLIPSHSLEDFPTELGEKDAASLLNAFAVVWHPSLLAASGTIPVWHRADEPPESLESRLFIVPTAVDDWIPSGWVEHARSEGAVVVSGLHERQEMLDAALAPFTESGEATPSSEETTTDEPATGEPPGSSPPHPNQLDADLVADFLALGTCYLQLELLTRHMHHFSNLDEVYLQREAVAAAKAVVADDATAARTHLQTCFEVLTEARERFYPVDCYLLDLCLFIPRLAGEHLQKSLDAPTPVNLLATGEDLDQVAADHPELTANLRKAWEEGRADVAGGALREPAATLLPLDSFLWHLDAGHAVFRRHFGRTPTTWASRRFALSLQIPQIAAKFGCHSALHVLLDDGLYPDSEESKIRWEGCDGTVVDAISRIPLPADSAVSYLRFPVRMAESMEQDQVAAVILARWPEVTAPWFDDFRRMHNYSPVLGRFVTFDHFFQTTDDPGRLTSHQAKEYLSPFLLQSVARREKNPISRYVEHLAHRQQFDSACWFRVVAELLAGRTVSAEPATQVERALEEAGPDADDDEQVGRAAEQLATFCDESTRKLTDLLLRGAGGQPGYLVLNPLAFARTVNVELPDATSPPKIEAPVKSVQFDDQRQAVTVDVPGSGFVWLPADGGGKPVTDYVPTVEETVLRNEFFEVVMNEVTGGIARIKGYGRSPNRLSQQVSFRFPRERTFTVGEGEESEQVTSCYAEMRCRQFDVTCDGPALGEIVTSGDVVDQKDDSRLAGFRQITRLWRGRPLVEIDLELDVDRQPEGDPWSNYYGIRFAWNDSTASLTRSVQQGAQTFVGERFETLHYLELATPEQRTTILNQGLPFFRKTGPRMVDCLLVAEGETRRRFQFAIAVDVDYPLQTALDVMAPVRVIRTETGPPRSGTMGWFFHLNVRNVQILRLMPADTDNTDSDDPWSQYDREATVPGRGVVVRLLETEGRQRKAKLRCFARPTRARQRDFTGRTIQELTIEDDAVVIELTGHEIADVELRF